MSAMVNLEIPWINVMSKMDLVTENPEDPSSGARNGLRGKKDIARSSGLMPRWPKEHGLFISLFRFLDPDPMLLETSLTGGRSRKNTELNPRFHSLNQALVQLVRSHLSASKHLHCFCLLSMVESRHYCTAVVFVARSLLASVTGQRHVLIVLGFLND